MLEAVELFKIHFRIGILWKKQLIPSNGVIRVIFNLKSMMFFNQINYTLGLVIGHFDFFHIFCIRIPTLFSLPYALDKFWKYYALKSIILQKMIEKHQVVHLLALVYVNLWEHMLEYYKNLSTVIPTTTFKLKILCQNR